MFIVLGELLFFSFVRGGARKAPPLTEYRKCVALQLLTYRPAGADLTGPVPRVGAGIPRPYARYCIHALKAESQRPLHHARRAGGYRLPETRIGLRDLTSRRIKQEGQIGIDVIEICMVEKVVGLPAELKTEPLPQADVLEKRQVGVNDPRPANHVSRRIAYLAPRQRTGEA